MELSFAVQQTLADSTLPVEEREDRARDLVRRYVDEWATETVEAQNDLVRRFIDGPRDVSRLTSWIEEREDGRILDYDAAGELIAARVSKTHPIRRA